MRNRRRTTNINKDIQEMERERALKLSKTWERFELSLYSRNRSAGTIDAYKKSLIRFGRYLAGHVHGVEDSKSLSLDKLDFITIDDITAENIESYFIHMRQIDELASKSILNQAKNLSAYFTFLSKTYKIEDLGEYLPNLKVEEKIAFVPTDEQLLGWLGGLDVRIFTEFRTYVLVTFLANTACRLNEVENIRLSDINLQERKIKIHEKKNRRERMISINNNLSQTLSLYLEERGKFATCEYLFVREDGGKLTSRTMSENIKAHSRNMGSELTAHSCRRFAISKMVNAGIPLLTIARVCGVSANVILKHYYQATDENIKDAFSVIKRKK